VLTSRCRALLRILMVDTLLLIMTFCAATRAMRRGALRHELVIEALCYARSDSARYMR